MPIEADPITKLDALRKWGSGPFDVIDKFANVDLVALATEGHEQAMESILRRYEWLVRAKART